MQGVTGMTDRQFDSHIADQITILKQLLDDCSDDAKKLRERIEGYIANLESRLTRP